MAECHLFHWWKITLGPNNHGAEQHGSKYHAHGCCLFVLCKRGYKWIYLCFLSKLYWDGGGGEGTVMTSSFPGGITLAQASDPV